IVYAINMPRRAKSFKIPMYRPVLRPRKSQLEGYPVIELEKSQRIRVRSFVLSIFRCDLRPPSSATPTCASDPAQTFAPP
ncbi:hypothetical protein C0993_010941, partial [Termitomyces sp. T159_Od127]